MQIRTLFLVCMSVVAATGACLGGWMLAQMVVEYRLAGRVERAVDIDTLLFIASDKMANERPVTGNALLADTPISDAVSAKQTAARQATDVALQQLRQQIEGQTYPGAAGQLAIVRKAATGLATWRAKADAALSLPKSQRDPHIFTDYLGGVSAVFEATNIALDIGDMAASLHDGKTVELIELSRFVWAARSTMGLRTVPLMATIDAGAKLSIDQLETQARYHGNLEATWTAISALSRRLVDMPNLPETIVTASAAFNTYNSLCHEVIAANKNATTYPVSALDLGRNATATAPLLLKIRDEALAAAHARTVTSRELAGLYVVIAAVVLVLTMIAMIVVLTLLQQRIVSPMLAMTEVIGRIARLDFDVTIPGRKRTDEIGRMAEALDALRLGAMAGEENKAQIVHLARHDMLTGLANRLALQEELEQAVAMGGRGQISAVLCLDLDRFKAVNDTFGHPTGDLLLQRVAERLLACVRDVDTVSRLGGDEFVVLLLKIEAPDHAAVVAQRIVQMLSEPFDLDGQTVSIGCSVGIAITPQDASSGVALLKRADTALYRAKTEEKGTWRFFRPEMDASLQARSALENDLRNALETQAFELVYQPQYNLATNRLCGFEALLRWRHPVHGLTAPADFIPIAEETGLIKPIGAWVLREACAEAMQWPDDISLAVNMSGVQFKDAALVEIVRQALADAGLPPTRLELEITETMLLSNSPATLQTLHELHDMGIRIAMDDFGTGYSSLSYLRSFPFDKIKIDQSFIRDLSDDSGSRAIVRSVVALGKSLGMTTTAEGVETEEQLAHLRLEGCADVQGYLFSRPIGPMEARSLVRQGSGVEIAVD